LSIAMAISLPIFPQPITPSFFFFISMDYPFF
jgi:hypothetical protein